MVTHLGMSYQSPSSPGEKNPTPFAFDDSTRASLQELIAEGVAAAFAAQQKQATDPQVPGSGAGADPVTRQGSEGAAKAADTAPVTDQAAAETRQDNQDPNAVDGEELEDDSGEEEFESEEDDDDKFGGNQPSVFSKRWNEAHRDSQIASRFEVPARFQATYPVGFSPGSVEHFGIFGPGSGASVGRVPEASSLYATAAYTSVVNNTLSKAVSELPNHPALSHDLEGSFGEILAKISDAQVATYGIYKLVG